jgi:Fic family protein
MDALESYMNVDDEPDSLVQLAIVHVEFEALHPFRMEMAALAVC